MPPRPGRQHRNAVCLGAGPQGPDKEPILLRLGSPLLEILDRLAAAEFRSRQGQIEKLLHEALLRRGAWPPKADAESDDDGTAEPG